MESINGIYYFGGKNIKGEFTNNLSHMKLQISETKSYNAEFVKVKYAGLPPLPRLGHTMSFLPVANALLVIGGNHIYNNKVCV